MLKTFLNMRFDRWPHVMPRKLVKLVGFDYEEDEGEVQFRDGVQTAEITLLG